MRGRNGVRPQKGRGNGSSKVLQVVEGVWKDGVRENANKKDMKSCYRSQGGVQSQ